MAEPKTKRSSRTRQIPDSPIDSTSSPSFLATDASPSDPAVLRTLYSVLLKTRLLEEHMIALSQAGKLFGVSVPVLGGEATEVGACIGLRPDDSFSSSQPRLAIHVASATPLNRVFAQILANGGKSVRSDSLVESPQLRLLPPTATLSGQLDIAAGVALAYRELGKPNVVVALADDGLAALGFWHEAASLASRRRLPIVFMVENSARSHSNGASAVHSNEDLRDRAEAYGFPGITVDGNDLVAVWRVTQESIHRARSGAGPTLIECRTWRWHAEADNPAPNGRSNSKLLHMHWQNDPLHHMEHYMKKRKLWQQAWKEAIAAHYRTMLDAAVKSTERVTHPD